MLNCYVIKEVKYNDNAKKDYITHLLSGRLLLKENESININNVEFAEYIKEQIVCMIEMKVEFYTLIEKNGQWELGSKVEVIENNNTKLKYLRTKGNNEEKDNLGDLPIYN